MASLLEIPCEVTDIWDDYHLDKDYCVCRFCYGRISGTVAITKRQPLSSLVVLREKKFYSIDFSLELTDMSKPKSLCSSCKRRLVRLDSGEIPQGKWAKLRISIEFQPMIDRQVRNTRQTVSCSVGMRCQVCQIASSLVNNRLTKMQSNLSSAGRPLEQSPRRSMYSKCGQFMDSHDKYSCNKVLKHPRSAPQAAQLFAERVQARGHTDRFACERD